MEKAQGRAQPQQPGLPLPLPQLAANAGAFPDGALLDVAVKFLPAVLDEAIAVSTHSRTDFVISFCCPLSLKSRGHLLPIDFPGVKAITQPLKGQENGARSKSRSRLAVLRCNGLEMHALSRITLGWLALVALTGAPFCAGPREQKPQPAQVTVHAGRAGCSVELDAQAAGKTNAEGKLTIPEVEPGDHYLHVDCPGEPEEASFVSLRAGENLELRRRTEGATAAEPATSAQATATRIQLRRLVQQAVQLRARGRLDEAVARIRQALKLDPENSDLHRELGITFLLGRDWKRARVEMLEAIRHDPNDADAHNGLGYALEKLGDIDGAVKEYRLATRLDPDDPTYRTHYFDGLAKLAAEKAKNK